VDFVTDDFPNRLSIGVSEVAEVHAKMGIVILGNISIRKKISNADEKDKYIIQHIFLTGL
jgi:CRISPR/Cas system-associated protein endoribonuclease Cas2